LRPRLRAQIVTRWVSRPWRWLWSWLWRRPLVAPELESMKLIFHLQRYGVVVPRLLAAGQKTFRPWQTQSFLLTELLPQAIPLAKYLVLSPPSARRTVSRQAARLLRQMHEASCYLDEAALDQLLTVCLAGGAPMVALATIQGIEKKHHPNPARARRDAAALFRVLSQRCSATDLLQALLAYLDKKRLTPSSKAWARKLLEAVPETRRVAA
jgi:hypothetical protein